MMSAFSNSNVGLTRVAGFALLAMLAVIVARDARDTRDMRRDATPARVMRLHRRCVSFARPALYHEIVRWVHLVRLLVACVLLTSTVPARAQSPTTGAIAGRVTDAISKEPLIAVAVTVVREGGGEPQTVLTDENGVYKITELLPGFYTVTFEVDALSKTKRTHVQVDANGVASVYQAVKHGDIIEVVGKAPQIRQSTLEISRRMDHDFLTKMPLPTRNATDAAGAAAGAHNDGVGIAFSGSTALENRFLVDGIDITGLTLGDVGTPVLNDFVEQIEVLSGGFNAEWGRATGGIVNIVTKSGTNEVHGSVFGTLSPGVLTANRQTTPTNAASIDLVGDRAYNADFGAEVGGPLIKDRLWFYAGLAPQLSRTDLTRITKRQTDCRQLLPSGELSGCDPRLVSQGGFADGAPDVDPSTGFFITDEIDRDVRQATSEQLSSIAKLNLAVTPRHQAQISLIAVPGRSRTPGLFGLPSTGSRTNTLSLDGAARWTSKVDDDRLELEGVLAWHHSSLRTGALDPTLDAQPRQILLNGSLGTWSGFGGESARTVAGCTDGGPGSSDPYFGIVNCPMDTVSYAIGGPGPIAADREDRITARFGVTRRGHLAGSHEIKAGIDIENNSKVTARLFSGGALIQNFVDAGVVDVTRWVGLAPLGDKDPRYDHVCKTPDPEATGGLGTGSKTFACEYLPGTVGAPGTEVTGQTIDWSTYLRDSWQPWPNLTLNAGVRYEEQQLRYAESLRGKLDPLTGERHDTTALDLTNNWAPRLGVAWDPTEEGRAKLWLSYGRFFEAIPMDINDRSFGGEVSYQQSFQTAGTDVCGSVDPRIGAADGVGCLTPNGAPAVEQLIGSSGVLVAPGTKSQYLDEVVAGAQFQLADDLMMGITYQHRWLGRVIEDVSTDGAQTYVIANPGEWSADEEARLEQRIAAADDPVVRGRLEDQLAMFQGIRAFDRPSRTYRSIALELSKRLSHDLFVRASYTYSRTRGNFPGSVSYDNGQRDPNISSQYDLIELLANRYGPLPQDRPHSLKVDAFYTAHPSDRDLLTIGARVRAVSGIPRNALGAHYLYGPNESFLLPRGELGRTELERTFDLKLSYGRKLNDSKMTAEIFLDVFNVLNHQGTFDVDSTYAPSVKRGIGGAGGTLNNVNPVSGGTYEDLIFAKAIDANGAETSAPTARNPNFQRTISRYAPASAQVGFRLTF